MPSSIDVSVHNDSTLLLKLIHEVEGANLVSSKRIHLPASSKSIRFLSTLKSKVLYLLIDCLDSRYTPTDYNVILIGPTADKNIALLPQLPAKMQNQSNEPHIGCVKVKLVTNIPLITASILVTFKNGIKFNKHIHLFNRMIVMSGISIESPDEYYNKGIGLDFTIMVSNEIIKASKYILGLHSPVFKAMFENDWKDARENLIQIDDIDYEIMLSFVKAMHSVPVYLNDIDVALKLIIVADKYNVEEIKQQALYYLKGEINKDNAINILTLAHKLNIEEMKREALNFMTSRKYGKIEELKGWDQMQSDIALLVLNETRSKLP